VCVRVVRKIMMKAFCELEMDDIFFGGKYTCGEREREREKEIKNWSNPSTYE